MSSWITGPRSLLVLGTLPLAGCDARVGNADALWLLWLVPALLVFYVSSFRHRRKLLERFASSSMLERLASDPRRGRQSFKAALVLLAVAALVLALAELKWGFHWEEIQRKGVDIVVALDVSDSMLVQDAEIQGVLSRLERAKREITDLLRLLQGDRIALVAFAGTAFVECPLTLDYGAAELFLSAMEPDLIPVKGTSIADALEVSLDALESSARSSKAIILITDGEDHSGRLEELTERAKAEEVRVFAIGIGRGEGSPIRDPGGGFRRDGAGDIVLSRLDETTLQKLALATGGRYVRSVTGDLDLDQIYTQGIKATLVDQELESRRKQRWEERFQWMLAVALFCLMLEPLISRRGQWRTLEHD